RNRQSEQFPKQADERNGEGGRAAEAGARRRVGMDEKVEAFGAKLVELEALQHPLDQIHLAVETEVFLLGKVNHRAVIEGTKANRTLRLWHQRRVDVARDRGVEHTAAARFGVRRYVGAASTKTQ